MDKKIYYENLKVLDLIYQNCKFREVAYLKNNGLDFCRRHNFFFMKSFMYKSFDYVGLLEKELNLYVSCAKYKKMPFLVDGDKNRKKVFIDFFLYKAHSELLDYDILLDFDNHENKDINEFYTEMEAVFHLLLENNICFQFLNSGSGYHFVICNNSTASFIRQYDLNRFPLIDIFIKNFNDIFNLNFLCTIGVGDIRKLRKCPFSIDFKSGNIALLKDSCDFTTLEYKKFNVNMLPLLQNTYFNDYGAVKNAEHFDNFIKKYGIMELN